MNKKQRKIKNAADEDFLVASPFIRSDLRKHLFVFYRFARTSDEIADNPLLTSEERLLRLEHIVKVLDGLEEDCKSPAAAMRLSLSQTGVKPQHCHDLLHAFTIDAHKLRYRDWEDLMSYCRYSVMPIGRQILDLHGEDPNQTWPLSDALTSALQVLNIVEDCKEDYLSLNRVYLPAVYLSKGGGRIEDLGAPRLTIGLRKTLDSLLDSTSGLLIKAKSMLGSIRSFRLRAEASAVIYIAERHLDLLRRGDPLVSRIKPKKRDFIAGCFYGAWEALKIQLFSKKNRDVYAELSRRIKTSHTSFYWGMRLLPKPRREAMCAIYAFCREVDNISDSCMPPAEKLAALAKWRKEIEALFEGRPVNAVARVLMESVRRYNLRKKDFLSIIEGMEMDAKQDIQGLKFDELDHYCDCVASAVGRLSVRVFGSDSPASDQVAASLGRALQLTNILRDIDEDASNGRLYLPLELLLKHGIETTDPARALRDPAIANVCSDLALIAENHYRDAWAAMDKCPRWTMRPARIMAGIYHAILNRLVQSGWRHLDQPVHVSKAAKIWVILRYSL